MRVEHADAAVAVEVARGRVKRLTLASATMSANWAPHALSGPPPSGTSTRRAAELAGERGRVETAGAAAGDEQRTRAGRRPG